MTFCRKLAWCLVIAMADAAYKPVAFKEAIDFFLPKTRLPTRRWNDIEKDMHARAFVVAGAVKDELLSDLQAAVLKGLTAGTTLAEFRKDFDAIVARHGWTGWTGEDTPKGRAWRTRTIFETNLRTAYQAGRYKQLTDPAMLRVAPYWEYVHDDSVRHPRPHHLAWDGTVLPANHKWFDTHWCPNGWGCRCRIVGRSAGQLRRMGKSVSETPPDSSIDPKTGAPVGIDKGWDYNVGKAAWGSDWGRKIAERGRYQELQPWRPANYPELPSKLTPKPAPAAPLRDTPYTREELQAVLPEGIYTDPLGQSVNIGSGIIDHWLEDSGARLTGRQRYLPLLPFVVQQPQEIWIGFIQWPDGKVDLLRRYIAAYDFGASERSVGVVADYVDGQWIGLTAFQDGRLGGGRLRSGRLLWSDEAPESK